MWSSTSPDFDLETFMDHLRATKPPYYCPYPQCNGKIYRSFSGMEKHFSTQHKEEWEERKRKTDNKTDDIMPPAATCLSPSRVSAPAQRLFDVEVDGRVWRLNVLEPLQVVGVNDKQLEQENKSQAVLDRYKNAVLHSPTSNPPVAKFKVIDVEQKKVGNMNKEYVTFIQQTPEMLDKTVEYDMDEEDYLWLEMVNTGRKDDSLSIVNEGSFEFVMDRLEKECQFQVNSGGSGVDEDAVCCVCLDGECHNANVILFCDMCNLAVHQDCYGVPYVPEGQWLCRRCQLSPSQAVDCCLCPNKGGAFKQTNEGQWCHVVCAIWVPDVYFANTVFLEPVEGIDKVHKARFKLRCIVCKQKGVGACIQCQKPSCYTAFHVTCAQSARLFMKVETSNMTGPGSAIVKKFVYCDMHAPVSGSQSMQSRKDESMKKLRNARKILSQRRNSAPTVSIPVIPIQSLNRIANTIELEDGIETWMRQIVAYWTLKRESRFGVPLLRRLQVFHHKQQLQTAEASGNTPELKRKLHVWKKIRQNLEKARLLCELIRKRERLKKDYVESVCELVESQLKPVSSTMVDVIDKILVRDRFNVFTQPVSEAQVPGYGTVIKRPMDLSTMKKKSEKGQYKSLNELQADFKLMIDNCIQFNPKGEFFWKQALRVRRLGNSIINEARLTDTNSGKSSSKKKDCLKLLDISLMRDRTPSPFPEFVKPTTVFSPPSSSYISEEPKSPPKSPAKPPRSPVERPKSLGLSQTTPRKKASTSLSKINRAVTAQRPLKRKIVSGSSSGGNSPKRNRNETEIVDIIPKGELIESDGHKNTPIRKGIPIKKSRRRTPKGSRSALVQTSITKFMSPSNDNVKDEQVDDCSDRNSSPEGNDYLPSRLSPEPAAPADRPAFNVYRQNDATSPASVPSSSEDSGLDEVTTPSTSSGRKRGRNVSASHSRASGNVIDVTGGTEDVLDFVFMDLVWAPFPKTNFKLPALVHNEGQKNKIYVQVLPIHTAPTSVLRMKPVADELVKLIRFFDEKRTWCWAPVSDLRLFGIDDEEDLRVKNMPKKVNDKQMVDECMDRAIFARHLFMGESPPDRLINKYGEGDVEGEDEAQDDNHNARCSIM